MLSRWISVVVAAAFVVVVVVVVVAVAVAVAVVVVVVVVVGEEQTDSRMLDSRMLVETTAI